MAWPFFRRFTAEVDIKNENHVHFLEKRDVPISSSPFAKNSPPPDQAYFATHHPAASKAHDSGQPAVSKALSFIDDQPIGERPPFWLELSGDLAWSAAFASLTNNRSITAPGDIVNYTVFFALVWQLWASQAAYDIRFYTNDWWHRVFFVFQLITYGILSAFTADFDVFWWLKDYTNEVFTDNVSILTAGALVARAERAKELSLMGVSLTIALNRGLLLFQYIRVDIYRLRHGTERWRYHTIPFSIAISCLCFLGCFLIIRFGKLTRATSIIQFSLWGTSMVLEILGHALALHEKENLKSMGSIVDRLSTLTVIVMGEGLNSICAVLQSTVNAVGVGFRMIAILMSLGLTLYFIWLCYFDAFRTSLPQRKVVRQIWFIFHFPFHLSLILVLEGMKNMLLQSNLVISVGHMYSVFKPREVNPNTSEQTLVDTLEQLGVSWAQVQIDSTAAKAGGETTWGLWYQRFVLDLMRKVFAEYQDIDDETAYNLDQYNENNQTVLADLAAVNATGEWGPNFNDIINQLEKPLYTATTYLVPMGGVVVIFIGILHYVQRTPRDRYEWGSILNKIIAGCVLVILVSVNLKMGQDGGGLGDTVWRLPTLAIALGVVVIIDGQLFRFSVRSMRRQKDASEHNQDLVERTAGGQPQEKFSGSAAPSSSGVPGNEV